MKTIKSIFSLVVMLIFSAGIAFASSGDDESQIRDVSGFNAIKVATGIDLYITMGTTEEVKIVADDEIIDDIKTEVKNGTLSIYLKRNNGRFNWRGFNKTRKAYVTLKELTEIKASSGADVESQNTLKGEMLEVSASSGSDVKIDVIYKKLSVSTSSGSDAYLSGKVKTLFVHSSSGSDIDAAKLETERCEASASSGSDIVVRVTEELRADASSGADIVYYGKPQNVDTDESSGGDVKRR